MRGICSDPRYPEGDPRSTKAGQAFRSTRYVLFPDSWPVTSDLINSGWYVTGVIARESGDPAQYANWGPPNFDIVIGNEPDGSGESSWIMTPAEYGQLWQSTNNYSAQRWIAGMCSGDVARAAEYVKVAPGAAGLHVHLYGLTPGQAKLRVSAYRGVDWSVRVGEWHPADGYRYFDYSFSVPDFAFCLSDAMVPDMGLWA